MQQEQLNIHSAETARIFEDRDRVRMLEPFIQEPRTLSEAAHKLGIKAPRLHYHVKRFLEHGLLEATGTTRRNGRAVKLYQTTARAFFVPFELTSSEALEGLITNLATTARASFIRASARVLEEIAPNWGIRWSHNGENALYYAMLPEDSSQEEFEKQVISPAGPAIISFHDALMLEHETAKTLQHDLIDLSQRYYGLQSDKGQRYSIQIGLVPVPND